MGRLPSKAAIEALTTMLEYGFPTVPSSELAGDALAIALSTGRTVYDAMYIPWRFNGSLPLSPPMNA